MYFGNDLKTFYLNLSSKYPTINDVSFKDQVNFQNHREVPVHRWLKYREGYSVELVNKIIQELDIKGNILDPFLGSGTTTFASSMLGRKAYGIEISPFPAFVAKVKTRKYSKSFVKKFKNLLPKLLEKNKKTIRPELKILDKAFSKDVLNALLYIKSNIDIILDKKERDLAFFVWLSILEDVSNTFKEGNGIKYKGKFGYKRPPRKGTPKYEEYVSAIMEVEENKGWKHKDVFDTFRQRFDEVIEDISLINYDNWIEPTIILGDAKDANSLLTNIEKQFGGIDLTVFSPPYANCFDYFEIFKIELWMGGFVNNYDELRSLRRKGLVSNLNADLKNIEYFNESLEFLINKVDVTKLWSKNILSMLRGYFRDMTESLLELWKITNKGGYVVIVVASSSYGDVIFPTDSLLAEIAEGIGYKVMKISEVRTTNTSSQQRKRFNELGLDTSYLRESLVYLRKL